jgi:broad specificity phosphatase PhoE
MSALYLVRHGQAGRRDAYDTLSDVGRRQARLLGEYFAREGVHFTAIFSGALERQLETARELIDAFAEPPEIVIDPRWNEFDLAAVYKGIATQISSEDGEFQAAYEAQLRAEEDANSPIHRSWTRIDVLVMRAWIEGRYTFDGESWVEFQERVTSSLDDLRRFGPGEAVLVSTSATPIGAWAALAVGATGRNIMRFAGVLHNTSFTTFRLQPDDLMLFSLNNVPHLTDSDLRTFR